MALGQAAGVAAHLAISGQKQPRAIDLVRLQRLLIARGQILTFFKDLDPTDPAHAAIQYFGTKGFFRDYFVRSKDALDRKLAEEWIEKVLPERKLPSSARDTVSGAEVEALLPGLRTDWRDVRDGRRSSEAPVRRGEFCRALYEWMLNRG